jgi:hypothetical protein
MTAKIKIIDATSSAKEIRLTPKEALNSQIICQGFNRVDIYLPHADHFPRTTEGLTVTREKINQPVFIHSEGARFQNQFDLEMTMISLDIYFSRTIRLIKEDRLTKEWYILSNGQQGYEKRDVRLEFYGSGSFVQGTAESYFFSGAQQTGQTSTTYPGVRSFLWDNGCVTSVVVGGRDQIIFSQPGNYQQITQLSFLSISTEPTSLRFRLRKVNDYSFEESGRDILLLAEAGTQRHSINEVYDLTLTKLLGTSTAYNTSGTSNPQVTYEYDVVVTGNGTWYPSPDLPSNTNIGWQNKIFFELRGDLDVQRAAFGTSFNS